MLRQLIAYIIPISGLLSIIAGALLFLRDENGVPAFLIGLVLFAGGLVLMICGIPGLIEVVVHDG